MFSQVIRFTLQPSLAIAGPEFLKLRQDALAAGASAQYFGYRIPTRPFSHPKVPKPSDEICWVIQWPDDNRPSFATSLAEIASGDATYLEVEFTDAQASDLLKALEAPVSEFAFVRLLESTRREDPGIEEWIEKGYKNSFKMDGFTGGQWSFVLSTNDPDGGPYKPFGSESIPAEDRRLAIYYLGWESHEARIATTGTEIFAESLSKLMPYCGTGTGAWYVKFEKYV